MTERIAQLLKRRIGLDMDSVGELTVARAIEQRRRACGDPDLDAYWRRLNASESEQQELVEAVVVGETWFFRYPESFRSLQQQAFAALTRLAGRRGLRILCIPCSSGEEPYSIVMSLLDAGLAPALFQVDAFDVSEQALAQAQAGVYGRNAFRGTDLAYRERYFLPGADGHHLSAAVRDRVDLLITDIDMPRMDSIELVTLVRRDPRLQSLPVMVVSYKDREEDRRRGLDAGADYYLAKASFHDEALLDAVRVLIGEARG